MYLTDAEVNLLYDAVCDRLADYVHHHLDEFLFYDGDLDAYSTLYAKVSAEAKVRKIIP